MSSAAPIVIVVVNDTSRPITDVRVVYSGHILAADRVGAHERTKLSVEADREGDVDVAAVIGGVVREAPGAAHLKAHDDRILELHVSADRVGAVYLAPRGTSDLWAARVGVLIGVAMAAWFFVRRRRRMKKRETGDRRPATGDRQ